MPEPSGPVVLALHTAGAGCEAAVASGDGRVLAVCAQAMTTGQDARLPGMVGEVLAAAGLAPGDLHRIVVVAGPGSFTGVRVGVAFARGLALAVGRPCFGVTSLEAMERLDAPGGGPEAGRVLALAPAKLRPPDQSWWAQVLIGGQGEGEALELDPSSVRQMMRSVDAVWGEELPADLGAPVIPARPSAVGAARFAAMRAPEQLRAPNPVYVRAPDAVPMRRS